MFYPPDSMAELSEHSIQRKDFPLQHLGTPFWFRQAFITPGLVSLSLGKLVIKYYEY